jgi:DNA helicase HerA-like ATPase
VKVYSASTVPSSPEPPGDDRRESEELKEHAYEEHAHHAHYAATSTAITTASPSAQPSKPSVKELVKRAEVVGNVFSRSVYGIDKIFITLRQGKKLPLGSYVFVLDDDGLPIVYQITSPEYYRYGYDFEKRLIAYGRTVKDDSYTYDCTGLLVGKLYEDGRIEPPRYPVPPLAEVYLCTPELVKMITEPEEEPKGKDRNRPPDEGARLHQAEALN